MINDLKKIGKTSSVFFLGKIFEAGLLLVFYLLIIKVLGAEIYGEFIYVFTFLQIIAMFIKLGLDQGIMAFAPKYLEKSDYKRAYSLISFTIYSTTIITSILILTILFNKNVLATRVLNNPEHSMTLLLLSPLLLFINFINISNGIFRSLDRIKYYIVGKNFILPLMMLFSVILVYFVKDHMLSLIIIYLLGWGTSSIYLLVSLIKLKNIIKIEKTFLKDITKLLKFSFPLMLSSFLGFLLLKLDSLMIGYFLEEVQVGVYNIASQIAILSSFVLGAFNTIFAPTISIYYSENKMNLLGNLYRSITRWVTLINLVFFSLIVILSKDIMGIFGEYFVTGALALVLIAAGQVVNAGVGSVGHMNTMTGYPQYELYTNIITLVLNVILNYFFIPNYGIEGAAFSSLIAVAFNNILRLLLMYKNLKIHPFTADYFKVVLITLGSLFIVFPIKLYFELNYFLNIILFSLLYIGILIGFTIKVGLANEDKHLVDIILTKINIKQLKQKNN
jgi:O-antigen/teichoic acid export membrane protein